jgi:hypothetical protein
MSANRQEETAPTKEDSNLTESEVKREAKDKKHPLDKYLAIVTTLSFLLNVYLIYDKLTQRAIEQPGPHVFRVWMSGFDTSLAQSLSDNEKQILESFGKPRFALTPEWNRLKDELSTLPPIRLRQETYKFLVLQNTTNFTYTGVKVLNGISTLADIGSLEPNITTFLYYHDEGVLASAKVKYRIRGDNSEVVSLNSRDGQIGNDGHNT